MLSALFSLSAVLRGRSSGPNHRRKNSGNQSINQSITQQPESSIEKTHGRALRPGRTAGRLEDRTYAAFERVKRPQLAGGSGQDYRKKAQTLKYNLDKNAELRAQVPRARPSGEGWRIRPGMRGSERNDSTHGQYHRFTPASRA